MGEAMCGGDLHGGQKGHGQGTRNIFYRLGNLQSPLIGIQSFHKSLLRVPVTVLGSRNFTISKTPDRLQIST
jgi:hypothetical protein